MEEEHSRRDDAKSDVDDVKAIQEIQGDRVQTLLFCLPAGGEKIEQDDPKDARFGRQHDIELHRDDSLRLLRGLGAWRREQPFQPWRIEKFHGTRRIQRLFELAKHLRHSCDDLIHGPQAADPFVTAR